MPTFPVLRAKLEPLFDLCTVVRRPTAPFDPWIMVGKDRMSGTTHDIVVCLVKGRSDPLGTAERRIDVLLQVCQRPGQRLFVPIDDAYVAPVGASRTQGTSVLITPHEPRYGSSIAAVMGVKSSTGVSAADALAFFEVVADTIIGGLVTLHRHGVPHAAVTPAAVRLPLCDSLHETMVVVASTHQSRLGGIAVGTLPQGATPAADWRAAEEVLVGLAASAALAHVSSRCMSYSLETLAAARSGLWPPAPVVAEAPESPAVLEDPVDTVDAASAPPSTAAPSMAMRMSGSPHASPGEKGPVPTLPPSDETHSVSSSDQPPQSPPVFQEEPGAVPCAAPNPPSPSPPRGDSTAGSASTRSGGSAPRISAASSSTPDRSAAAVVDNVDVASVDEVGGGHDMVMEAQAASPQMGWSPDEACSPDPFTLRLQQMVEDITAMSPERTAPRAGLKEEHRSIGRIRDHEVIGPRPQDLPASSPLSPAQRLDLRTASAEGREPNAVAVPASSAAAVGGWQRMQPRSGVLDFVAHYVSPRRSRGCAAPDITSSPGHSSALTDAHDGGADCGDTMDGPHPTTPVKAVPRVDGAGCCIVM